MDVTEQLPLGFIKNSTHRLARFLKTCIIYIPRGPMLDWSDSILASRVLHDLIDFGKRKNAIFLKIDPDLPITLGLPGSESFHAEAAGQLIVDKLKGDDWCYSSDQIQFKNTITLDSKLSENELLNRMKQKTRYNIYSCRKERGDCAAG